MIKMGVVPLKEESPLLVMGDEYLSQGWRICFDFHDHKALGQASTVQVMPAHASQLISREAVSCDN